MASETVTVWLKAIQYAEGNIGSDTQFDISVNGKTALHLANDISPGTTRYFNKPVFMQTVQGDQVKVSIMVNVLEKDLLADDRGQNSEDFLVTRIEGRQKLPPLKVMVQESLGIARTGRAASFVSHLEAERWKAGGLGVRHVVSDDNGWLLVRAEDGPKAETFSLPYLAKVEVTRVFRGREFFTVLEGTYAGRKASVTLRNRVSSLSPAHVEREPPVQLIYHKKRRPELEVPELGTFRVAWPPRNPFPVGATFKVEIPDFPHAPGQRYEARASFATSWFRIADPKVPDRYLHVGSASAGCSTVTDKDRWDELYRFLINRRLDDRHVGTLTVVGT